MTGLEPAASWSQTKHSYQTELHPGIRIDWCFDINYHHTFNMGNYLPSPTIHNTNPTSSNEDPQSRWRARPSEVVWASFLASRYLSCMPEHIPPCWILDIKLYQWVPPEFKFFRRLIYGVIGPLSLLPEIYTIFSRAIYHFKTSGGAGNVWKSDKTSSHTSRLGEHWDLTDVG